MGHLQYGLFCVKWRGTRTLRALRGERGKNPCSAFDYVHKSTLGFLAETRNITLVRAVPQPQIPVQIYSARKHKNFLGINITIQMSLIFPNRGYILSTVSCLCLSKHETTPHIYEYTHDVRTFLWRVARSCRACDSPTTRFPRYSGGKPSAAARANRSPLPRFWTRALPLPHKTTAVSLPILRTTRALPRAPRRAKETVLSWGQSGRRRHRVGSLRRGTATCRPRPAFTARLIAWRGQGMCVCLRY